MITYEMALSKNRKCNGNMNMLGIWEDKPTCAGSIAHCKTHPYMTPFICLLVVSTTLKNMKVSWDDYSQCMEKYKHFETTNQDSKCSSLITLHDWSPWRYDLIYIIFLLLNRFVLKMASFYVVCRASASRAWILHKTGNMFGWPRHIPPHTHS